MKRFKSLLEDWYTVRGRHSSVYGGDIHKAHTDAFFENVERLRETTPDYVAHIHSLPDHVKKSINHYTNVDHNEVNNSVAINNHLLGKNKTDEAEKHVKNIDEAYHNVPAVKEAYHVWTGVGKDLNISAARAQGVHVLHLPAYTSTTIDPRVAHPFSKTKTHDGEEYREIVRIHVPKGSKHMLSVNQYSEHPDEMEYLMKRDSKLRFKGEVNKVQVGRHTYHVHDAEFVE